MLQAFAYRALPTKVRAERCRGRWTPTATCATAPWPNGRMPGSGSNARPPTAIGRPRSKRSDRATPPLPAPTPRPAGRSCAAWAALSGRASVAPGPVKRRATPGSTAAAATKRSSPVTPRGRSRLWGVGVPRHLAIPDGESVPPAKLYRAAHRRLRRAQRRLSRCQEGSKRRQKARERAAKLHRHTAKQRRDRRHKRALSPVRRHGRIGHQASHIRGIARTGLAKSVWTRDGPSTPARWHAKRRKLAWRRLPQTRGPPPGRVVGVAPCPLCRWPRATASATAPPAAMPPIAT